MALVKKVLVNVIPVAVIVLFFQNCSPSPKPSAHQASAEKVHWVDL